MFSPLSSTSRSVTWPDAFISEATRITTAGEVAIEIAAAGSAKRMPTPSQDSASSTSAKVSADSSRLVASSQGLVRSQRRLIRQPISKSSRASARSTISRRLAFICVPAMPAPKADTMVPTVA